jgi:putative ABC transport system substrate-binding protein
MEGWTTMRIGRRQFVALIGGATIAEVLPSRAQEVQRIRTVGFLMGLANDAESQARINLFEYGLKEQGWIPGRNIQIEYRFAARDPNRPPAGRQRYGLHRRCYHDSR